MKPSRGWVTNLSLAGSKQWRLEAEMHGKQATTLCNKTKSSQTCQTKHELNHFDFSLWSWIPRNLESLLFYTKKTLACCYRKQLSAREGDTQILYCLLMLVLAKGTSNVPCSCKFLLQEPIFFVIMHRHLNGKSVKVYFEWCKLFGQKFEYINVADTR